jgi:hypothetical protein
MHKNNKSTTQEHLDEKIFSISMPSIFATQTSFQEFVHAPDLMQAHVLEPMLNLETYFVLPEDPQATETPTSKSLKHPIIHFAYAFEHHSILLSKCAYIFVLVFCHALVY